MILGGGVRRIWMDGRRASADVLPSPMGFARGRWEGDELVIETTHLLRAGSTARACRWSGDGTRLVERYTFSDDRLSIDRVMTIHDPYYTAPLIRRRGSARSDNPGAAEGGSSCDSISHYRDLAEQGLLESLSLHRNVMRIDNSASLPDDALANTGTREMSGNRQALPYPLLLRGYRCGCLV